MVYTSTEFSIANNNYLQQPESCNHDNKSNKIFIKQYLYTSNRYANVIMIFNWILRTLNDIQLQLVCRAICAKNLIFMSSANVSFLGKMI